MTEQGAEVCVLLTPRAVGGHETALFGWLADATREQSLRPAIVAPTPALLRACASHGLARWLHPTRGPLGLSSDSALARLQVLRALRQWPTGRPLLLAPGVLHADAWLLAAAVLLRHEVWVYVPMTYTAQHMGYRAGAWRDHLLAPWVKRVAGWITINQQQAARLSSHWQVQAPVLALPNRARLARLGVQPPSPSADGRLRVAFVGRYDLKQKGLDWLIEMIRQHPAWRRLMRWHFQGRGPGDMALLELASELGPHHVMVNRHAPLNDALAVNDVLLLCSRFEGLPLVALEAVSRGWPVVASHACGLQDILPARSQFDFGDVQGMSKALASVRTPQARAQAAAYANARLLTTHTEAAYRTALRSVTARLKRSRLPALAG
jgi:glycosyltransferase involved in cell wall biosynthesis